MQLSSILDRGPIQVHILHGVQIAIIFTLGCKIHHRFESRREEKKIRDTADCYFRILDDDLEDDKCSASTLQPQLRYAWGSKDK